MAVEASSLVGLDTGADDTYEHIPVPAASTQHSLSRAVYQRRAEYIRPQTIKIKVGTWNVAACKDVEKDVAGWFVKGKGIDKKLAGLEIFDGVSGDDTETGIESVEHQEQRLQTKKKSTLPLNDERVVPGADNVDLYVLGLQEIVELSSAKEYLTRVYNDPTPAVRWKKALTTALPPGYELVSEQQLSGLLLLTYASPKIASTIGSVSSVSVGTGFLGYLGNKGAVTTRIVLGETTRLVFVNCHLASGTGSANLDRRCWDISQILARTQFDPISHAGVLDDVQEGIGEEDFAFWFGDLNFRLDGLPGDDIRRLLMLHTKGEYDDGSKTQRKIDQELGEDMIVIHHVDSDDDSGELTTPQSNININSAHKDAQVSDLPDPDDFVQDPHSDPLSIQATIDSLLPHDELRHVQKQRKALHDGWREAPITFLPTYKYDVGTMGIFDSSEKRRAPSWCDRILFRTRQDRLEHEGKSQEEELARIRDEEMKSRGIDRAGDDDEVLFNYDPELDGTDAEGGDYDENEDIVTCEETVVTKEGHIDNIHLDVYTSHQRVLSSDHKPLSAVFTLRYDAVDLDLRSKIQQEVARELDRAENEARPGITIVVDHSHEVDDNSAVTRSAAMHKSPIALSPPLDGAEGVSFGEVRYLGRKTCGLTVANTSRVAATFSFVSRPAVSGGSDSIAPEWLNVDFLKSDVEDEYEHTPGDLKNVVLLEPGDAITVNLEVYVENFALVRALNNGQATLDDVLVLRVVDGRDHFIPIRGVWMQSCLGMSISELIRVPEGGVRAMFPPGRSPDDPHVNRGQDNCWSAPRELFKLTEAMELLTERAIAEKDMIESASLPLKATGWPFEQSSWVATDKIVRERYRSYVLEALDSDKNLVGSLPVEVKALEKLEIVAEILLLFLSSLNDGIITDSLGDRLDREMVARKQPLSVEEERAWVLDVLSSAPNHNISFVFLTSMLSKIAAELVPPPRSGSENVSGLVSRGGPDHRRSLSFKGRGSGAMQDPSISRRLALDRRWAEIFVGVVFKASAATRERERRAADDRKRHLIEIFLQGTG